MANYSLISNAKFRPFSFQGMMQPALLATQAHQQIEDAYGELANQAATVESMANEQTDPIAYQRYKDYANSLRSRADELATYGLNPSSRRSMWELKNRYTQDIVPIQTAWKRREEQIAEQRKAGNSMIYDYDAATTSLDRFLESPSMSYRSIDRKDLRNRAEVAYSKFKEQLREGLSGFGYDRARKLDKFHNTLVQSYGLSPEQASSFINAVQSGRLNETDAALRATYNALYNGTGVDSWDSDEAKNAVMNTILEGVNAGIGKKQASLVEDTQAKLDAEAAKQIAVYRATHPDTTPPANPKLPGSTVPIEFTDKSLASNNMKIRLAQATADFIYSQTNNKEAKAIRDKWKDKGGKEAAIEYWAEKGLDGNELGGLRWSLGNYIRENVTRNEDIINIWRAPYENLAKVKRVYSPLFTSRPSNNMFNYTYMSTGDTNGPFKSWGNFDDAVGSSYRMYGIDLKDNRTALSKYLDRYFARTSKDNNVALYNIKSIAGDGTVEYSKSRIKYSELPKKSDNSIDSDKINRLMLPDGNIMLYWLDDNGNPKRGVQKLEDIGVELSADNASILEDFINAVNLYSEGKISQADYNNLTSALGLERLSNVYLEPQEVRVKPYEIQLQ